MTGKWRESSVEHSDIRILKLSKKTTTKDRHTLRYEMNHRNSTYIVDTGVSINNSRVVVFVALVVEW